jgi:hypothetical protein
VSDKTKVVGTFMKADVPNVNGHVYPEAVVKKVVEQFNEKVAEKRMFGSTGGLFETAKDEVSLSEATHVFEKPAEFVDGSIKIEATIVDERLAELLKSNEAVGLHFGSRLIGRLDEDKKVIDDGSLKLIAVDMFYDKNTFAGTASQAEIVDYGMDVRTTEK